MLDIHTHILPKMDDGSRTVQQSRKLLVREKKQGIDCVVLTPHFYAEKESPDEFLKRRAASVDLLKSGIEESGLDMRLHLGAEVAFFVGISRVEKIDRLCIGGTRAILIEMPFGRWSESVFDELNFLIEGRGIQPIIAHIERYMQFQPFGTIRRLCGMGVWIQANAAFFIEWQTSWLAVRMLRKRRIHFIGSDCHDIKERKPNVGKALLIIRKRLGEYALDYLMHMEEQLLEGV